MAKYNITEKKEKEAAYRSLVSPKLMDDLKEKILEIILIQQKYKTRTIPLKGWQRISAPTHVTSLPW